MLKKTRISISISRQVGSGGSVIGRNLAKRLNYAFLDREIVIEAAKKLDVPYEEVESLDERPATLWESFVQSCQYGDCYYTPAEHIPSSREIHDAESEVLLDLSKEKSIVVVGRGANFVLKDDPHHVSIFLHASLDFRKNRIKKMFSINDEEALKEIQKTDCARENYIHKFEGEEVYDLRHYHIVMDTSLVGLEGAEELIVSYLKTRFGPAIIVEEDTAENGEKS